MTRKAILELLKIRVKQADATGQYPIQYIEGMCDMVWESWCAASTNSPNQDFNFFTKLYPAVAVTEDTASGYYSSVLPEQILKLERVGDGVMSINQVNSLDNDFKPVTEVNFRLMKGQEVARTGSDIYYYVTYNSVQYNESMDSYIADSGVDMRLSIPFSKYDLDEELPLPSGKGLEFTTAVLNLTVGTPSVNLTNKNSDV